MNRHLIWIISLVIALWPTWCWYVARMTDGSDEPYGILALVAAGFLLWRDRKEIQPVHWATVIAMLLFVLVSLMHDTMPNLIAGVLSMSILVLATGVSLRNPGIWGLLILSLPLIANLQFYLGYPLRWFAAVTAQGSLNLFGQGIERSGTMLSWQGKQVGVDPACSGIEMLWLGMFLAALLCGIRRYQIRRFSLVMFLSCICVVGANCLRVTLLFLKESGQVALPDWTHDGIGILIFMGLVSFLDRYLDKGKTERACSPIVIDKRPLRHAPALIVATLSFGLIPFLFSTERQTDAPSLDFPGWPRTWNGHYLESLPLSDSEKVFASNFPGQIAVFTTGPDKIIMRWITRPTRKLHSSADCLRAAVYQIETERAGRFIASKPEGDYVVEENIYNERDSWSEVSPWFWSASLKRSEGPWWAVTAIRSVRE